MEEKTAVSYAYIARMRDGDYFEATRLSRLMLEEFRDVVRHHEMMLTINLRRANLVAAVENCNELIRHSRKHGEDVSEYERHRDAVLRRMGQTRSFSAHGLWKAVTGDAATAPSRFAGTPLLVSGEGGLAVGAAADTLYIVFSVKEDDSARIACQLAPGEVPFVREVAFPRRVMVHGHFLCVSESLVLLQPCCFIGTVDTLLQ